MNTAATGAGRDIKHLMDWPWPQKNNHKWRFVVGLEDLQLLKKFSANHISSMVRFMWSWTIAQEFFGDLQKPVKNWTLVEKPLPHPCLDFCIVDQVSMYQRLTTTGKGCVTDKSS